MITEPDTGVHVPEQAARDFDANNTGFAGQLGVESIPSSPPSADRTRPTPLLRPIPTRSVPLARPSVTARGAMVAMFVLFLFAILVADWLSMAVLIGLIYAVGCVLAPYLVNRRALLQVVAAPPAVFLAAVLLTQVMTAQGSGKHGKAVSVLEGTALTLAATAPWLIGGTALSVGAALRKGLVESIRQLRAELRGRTSA